jgi:hypothetical protein
MARLAQLAALQSGSTGSLPMAVGGAGPILAVRLICLGDNGCWQAQQLLQLRDLTTAPSLFLRDAGAATGNGVQAALTSSRATLLGSSLPSTQHVRAGATH